MTLEEKDAPHKRKFVIFSVKGRPELQYVAYFHMDGTPDFAAELRGYTEDCEFILGERLPITVRAPGEPQ